MTSIINYLKYLWKAKGRHGTHSPFVYAFVEDVLHDKRQFYAHHLIQKESGQTGYSLREMDVLFKAIHYINPDAVLLSGNTVHLKKVIKASNSRMLMIDSKSNLPNVNSLLIVVESAELSIEKLQLIRQQQQQLTIIVLHPHVHESLWQQCLQLSSFNMTMDCWYMGLLFYNPSFKVKQHFFLR